MAPNYAPERSASSGRTVQLDGIALHYEDYGAGEPMVLLHGFGGSGRNWYPFLDALAGHYRLIVIDLPGHGQSGNPAQNFTHRQAAHDVFALLDTLGINCCSAMGISSGGMTLLHMAKSQPTRLDAMVLVSATTYFPEQARAIMRHAAFGRMPQPVEAMYRACATRGDEQIRQLIGHFNALGDNFDDMAFAGGDLATIVARTLVVHGDRDSFFPVDIPVSLYRAIPDAALWIIPNGEHVPIFDPAVPFTETALRFLAAAAPPAP